MERIQVYNRQKCSMKFGKLKLFKTKQKFVRYVKNILSSPRFLIGLLVQSSITGLQN